VTPLLRLDGAACIRGGRLLFEGLDLVLAAGDAALVTGPNGAGKSSLIRLAAGLLAPAAGIVERGAAALADERLALDSRLPLRRALAFWSALGDDARPSALDAAMTAMDLTRLAGVPVRMLSTGQRKRAALARVLASGADLWLLDEPANGLDADGQARLEAAMAAHRAGAGRYSPRPTRRSLCPAPSGWRWDDRPHPARAASRRHWGERSAAAGLFLLVATLFPFAVGPDAPLLARTGGGALWMAALLAALLPVDRLVEPDLAGGVLDQLAVRGIAEETVAAAKLAGHWLSFGPPLMLAALPAAALMKLPAETLVRLELGLLAGTPGLAALSLIVAALTAGLRGTGSLAGLLMLPLAVPLLIFGAAMVEPSGGGGALKLLAAVSLLLVAIAPFAAGAALRAGRD
jgi:heme exporter protein B